jgi:hypothetical protein
MYLIEAFHGSSWYVILDPAIAGMRDLQPGLRPRDRATVLGHHDSLSIAVRTCDFRKLAISKI